jgi:hypothetical protein
MLPYSDFFDLAVFAEMRGASIVLDTVITLLLEKISMERHIPTELLADLKRSCLLTSRLKMLADMEAIFSPCDVVNYEEHPPRPVIMDIHRCRQVPYQADRYNCCKSHAIGVIS